MKFLKDSLSFFLGKRSSHMGLYQYEAHPGSCQGKSMSGASLWEQIENAETHKENATIFSSEEALIQTLVGELMRYIPLGTPLVEMGIGTPRAVKRKALPIMNALFTTDYVCVDASCAFLQNLKQIEKLVR